MVAVGVTKTKQKYETAPLVDSYDGKTGVECVPHPRSPQAAPQPAATPPG